MLGENDYPTGSETSVGLYSTTFSSELDAASIEAIQTSRKFLGFLDTLQSSGLAVSSINIPWAVVRGGEGRKKFLFGAVEVDGQDGEGNRIASNIEILRGDAVGVVPVVTERSTGKQYVLLIKQNRLATGKDDFPEIMAGMLDEDPDAHAVAIKELGEELGIQGDPSRLVPLTPSGPLYTSPGLLD